MTTARDLEYFVTKHGTPTFEVKAPVDVVERLAPRLPKVIPDYWQAFGFSQFQKGYFQIVNPETYASVVASWTKETDLEALDSFHAIVMSCFGELYMWGEEVGLHFTISPMQDAMLLERRNNKKEIAAGKGEIMAESMFFNTEFQPESFSGKLFAAALARLGPLGPDQIYGFVPALPLGGQIAVENLQIVSAPEHLMMLAELSERPVVGFDDLVTRSYGKDAVDTVKKTLDG